MGRKAKRSEPARRRRNGETNHGGKADNVGKAKNVGLPHGNTRLQVKRTTPFTGAKRPP